MADPDYDMEELVEDEEPEWERCPQCGMTDFSVDDGQCYYCYYSCEEYE